MLHDGITLQRRQANAEALDSEQHRASIYYKHGTNAPALMVLRFDSGGVMWYREAQCMAKVC